MTSQKVYLEWKPVIKILGTAYEYGVKEAIKVSQPQSWCAIQEPTYQLACVLDHEDLLQSITVSYVKTKLY